MGALNPALPPTGGDAQAQQSAGEERRRRADFPRHPNPSFRERGNPGRPLIRHSREGGNLAPHPSRLQEGTRKRSKAQARRSARPQPPPALNPSFPRTREPRSPTPPVCGRGRASAAKRGGGEALAHNYPLPQPVIPANAGTQDAPLSVIPAKAGTSQPHPSRLREGPRKRSKARGRRSARPQLPATPTRHSRERGKPRSPTPPVCGRGRASAAKRGGGEALAHNYPLPQPVIPANAGISPDVATLRSEAAVLDTDRDAALDDLLEETREGLMVRGRSPAAEGNRSYRRHRGTLGGKEGVSIYW